MELDPAVVASLAAVTGQPEEMVRMALNAAFGNADVAADYLMNGDLMRGAAGRVPPKTRTAPRPAARIPLHGLRSFTTPDGPRTWWLVPKQVT